MSRFSVRHLLAASILTTLAGPVMAQQYATQLLYGPGIDGQNRTTEVGPGNIANYILGAPDYDLVTGATGAVNFTSYDPLKPYGRVTVGFDAIALDRAGDDIAIHYANWNSGENFNVFASSDGVNYAQIGSSTGGNPGNARTVKTFDLAAGGLAYARYVRVVNSTPYTDPAHNSSHHEGVDLDAIEIQSATNWIVPPENGRIDYTPLPDSDGKTKLVLLAHGWDSSPADLSGLESALRTRLSASNDVVISNYNWSDDADVIDPFSAALRARAAGLVVGDAITKQGYTEIHLIGHSAGAWLIDAAADKIRDYEIESSSVIDVQTTFLDAFTPLFPSLGNTADYAEHIIDDTRENLAGLPIADRIAARATQNTTAATLFNAFNIDVTGIDREYNSDPNNAFGRVWENHFFPVNWYSESASDNVVGWGFDQSVVLGTMPEYGDTYLGETLQQGARVLLNSQSHEASDILTVVLDEVVTFSATVAINSDTGVINDLVNSFVMATGSPVWKTLLIDTDGDRNFVIFDAEFLSEAGAEGLLSVYWNGELIGQIDERYV